MDLELNKSSRDNRSEKDIIDIINEIKIGHPNIIHKTTSLLNKDDYLEIILDIYRQLNNQVEKKIKKYMI